MGADREREYRIGRGMGGSSRVIGLIAVLVTYVAAGLAALVTALATRGHHPLTQTLWADLVATLVVFLASMAVSNSSVYDPYWSVAPPVVVFAWVGLNPGGTDGGRSVIVFVLVLIWAGELTSRWARLWRGLGDEDWRYGQIRSQTRGRLPWWLVSLTGIQLMPTLVVFAGLLGVWPVVAAGRGALGGLDALAIIVTLGAITIETLADLQLSEFRRDPANRERIADRGLWRYCRHPNYLGEIGFWWGLWLFGLAAAPNWWWTMVGPLTVLALFVFVSVPLMDRRSMQRRPDYADHMRRVPALIPLPGRRGVRRGRIRDTEG